MPRGGSTSSGLLWGAAGLAAGAAAGYYVYDQVNQRLPKWRQQNELLKEVGRVCVRVAGACMPALFRTLEPLPRRAARLGQHRAGRGTQR